MKQRNIKAAAALATAVVVLTVTIAGLFLLTPGGRTAWFFGSDLGAGSVISVSEVEGEAATEGVTLQISTQPDSFPVDRSVALVQVNSTDPKALFPVSTSDLKTFFYSPSGAGQAMTFAVVEEEQYYYHGRAFLRAEAGEGLEGAMALYFDLSQGGIARAESGTLNDAARLGLTLNEADPKIYRFSEDSVSVGNTYVDGEAAQPGAVLSGTADAVETVPDPAVILESAAVVLDGDNLILPETPVAELTLNTVYQLDVYYYLEGCDPECTNDVALDASEFQLAFTGVFNGAAVELTPKLKISAVLNGNTVCSFDSDVSGDCRIIMAVYDNGGKQIATQWARRTADQTDVELKLNVQNLPAQYTVKVFQIQDDLSPIVNVLSFRKE